MRWIAGLGVTGVALAACSSGSPTSSQDPSATAAPSPAATAVGEPAVTPSPIKQTHVTGRIRTHDAVWGELTVVTSEVRDPSDLYEGACAESTHLRVVDAEGRVRLRRDWEWGCSELEPNKPAVDRTGNVFLRYNPGRYYGVIIVRAAGGRLESFGTLPADGEYEGSGPFGYYASTHDDRPHDGVLEIRQFHNHCDPSCADGALSNETYAWDGRRYVRVS
jgi:hypothetical protein